MRKVKKTIALVTIQLALLVALFMPVNALAAPSNQSTDAGGSNSCNAPTILTFPVWYRGVVDSQCNVKLSAPTDIWKIVLNVIEILIQLAGYLAGIYILIGGFKYLTSGGSPDAIGRAGNTIRNASIGLIIALAATAIVRFIAGSIN